MTGPRGWATTGSGDSRRVRPSAYDARQITFDSIGRFKGQESPAVILVDVDPDPAEPERTDRLLFAGMTRATLRLELVVRAGNPLNRRFVDP